jgi:phosphatidylserine decarboxylase
MVIASFIGAVGAAILMLPLVFKWELGIRRVAVGLVPIVVIAGGAAFAIGAGLSASGVVRALLAAALTAAMSAAALAHWFYRDPERTPPPGEDLVVSPADGEVVYVKHSRNGRLPVSTKHGHAVALEELTRTEVEEGESIVIGIGMSFLDVHVNRAPIAGRVVIRRHFPGRFGSLRRPETVFENERATTLIAGPTLQVAVVQIASRLVRQIRGYVREGEDVRVGQRIGAIRFGSQVDIVLPSRPDLKVLVAPNDRVVAGNTVIAALTPTPAPVGAVAGEPSGATSNGTGTR